MNPTVCETFQSRFSAYLDGAVSGQEMQEIARHLEGSAGPDGGCRDCARELTALRLTQNALAGLGPAKPPADLSLRLRVAISRENARRNSRLLDRLSVKWDNAVRPLLVQVSAGVAGSVVLVGGIMLLLGVVAAPQPVLANDEPLGAVTAPHYRYSAVPPQAIATPQDTTIVIEAAIDKYGRVYDFDIIAGPQDPSVRTQVASQLLASVFEPASAFGVPIRGHAIVTFSGISVRG
ncbi:MAG TPA: anti-sigma factor [Acidobacteriaceae bacterium]|nr:anti-sigma factor [Acidobacteriaceae bacterium]